MDGRIVDWAPYGQHIGLRCKICGATFHTKNIAPLGCRSIFQSMESVESFQKSVECDNAGHTLNDLEVINPSDKTS